MCSEKFYIEYLKVANEKRKRNTDAVRKSRNKKKEKAMRRDEEIAQTKEDNESIQTQISLLEQEKKTLSWVFARLCPGQQHPACQCTVCTAFKQALAME